MSITGLDAEAQDLVRAASMLAEQHGVFPISDSALFSALLKEENGFAARACRCAGADPELLYAMLVATIKDDAADTVGSSLPLPIGLSPEACERIVLPVIETAKRLAPDGRAVTEKELFKAFCEKAHPDFKNRLKSPRPDPGMEILEVDLDELKRVDPDREGVLNGLTLRAKRVVRAAHLLSQRQGLFPISNRLMLAAFLGNEESYTARLFARHQLSAHDLAKQMIEFARGGSPRPFTLSAEACERIVAPTIERARALAGDSVFVTEQLLFTAFCDAADTNFKQALKSAHIDLDAFSSADGPIEKPGSSKSLVSREAVIQRLLAHQPTLETHHEARISRSAVVAAVDMSGRFILDKEWPDKALDALERASVLAATGAMRRRATIGRISVRVEHVAEIVARQSGKPIERVLTGDLRSLATLEVRIGRRVLGLQEAVRIAANAVRHGRLGIADKNRPWCALLFVGLPDVGKTELAEALAEEVYGGADAMVRFDAGDLTEQQSVSKLTGRLRAHPYSLLLFAEIERAHDDTLAVLLRLLGEGSIIDRDGNPADARNSIVIFTSNLLSPDHEDHPPIFSLDAAEIENRNPQTELRSLMHRHFPGELPGELIDRMDAIIRFDPIS